MYELANQYMKQCTLTRPTDSPTHPSPLSPFSLLSSATEKEHGLSFLPVTLRSASPHTLGGVASYMAKTFPGL
jgi:hypothetical protein